MTTALDFHRYTSAFDVTFTGREWILGALDRWLQEREGPRIFLIVGEPGSGKTALLAHLYRCRRQPDSPWAPSQAAAFHFCAARDRYWIDPRVFSESLAAQLIDAIPGFSQQLMQSASGTNITFDVAVSAPGGSAIGVVIQHLKLSIAPVEDVFNAIVRQPLEETIRTGFAEPLLFVVDALDEALLHSGPVNIADLIAQAWNLPPNVRFVLATRPIPSLLRDLRRAGAEEHSLSAGSDLARCQDDIERYIRREIKAREPIARRLRNSNRSCDEFAPFLSRQSAGNFLYVRLLLDSLERAPDEKNPAALQHFPAGLDAFYLEFLDRLKKNDRIFFPA